MTGKLCASLSSYTGTEDLSSADMVEIRLDLIDHVPNIKDMELLVTFRNGTDLSMLPENYSGMIDIGEDSRPSTNLKIVSSFHDYEKTPSSDNIITCLNNMCGDICKGAFSINSLKDLHELYIASQTIERKHVLLGMGELGAITRIRKNILKNEFTFGFVGEPTAPGQLSIDKMRELDDDCMILGLIGHPLSKSRSPGMHNAALKKTGINGIYLKFDSENIENATDVIREYNIRGVNVTVPHKQNIIDQIDSFDKISYDVGAINTIVNNDGKLKGYNTDVLGIDIALKKANFDPYGKRAIIMGSGGAARACAYYLSTHDCDTTIIGRNESTAQNLAKEFGCHYRPKDSVSVAMHDLIVNCTPVGMYGNGDYPINLKHINKQQTIFDMVYGKPTPIVMKAHTVGAKIVSGADMLAGQGAASFELWTGHDDQYSNMRDVLE